MKESVNILLPAKLFCAAPLKASANHTVHCFVCFVTSRKINNVWSLGLLNREKFWLPGQIDPVQCEATIWFRDAAYRQLININQLNYQRTDSDTLLTEKFKFSIILNIATLFTRKLGSGYISHSNVMKFKICYLNKQTMCEPKTQ